MFPPHATRVNLSAPSVPDAGSHALLWSVAKCDSLLRPTVPAVVDVADAELPDAVIAVGTSQRTTRLAVSSEFQQFCPPTVRVMHFTLLASCVPPPCSRAVRSCLTVLVVMPVQVEVVGDVPTPATVAKSLQYVFPPRLPVSPARLCEHRCTTCRVCNRLRPPARCGAVTMASHRRHCPVSSAPSQTPAASRRTTRRYVPVTALVVFEAH